MPCVKSGARAGSLYRNLVAHALTLGASGDRAPVRQQPCLILIHWIVIYLVDNIIHLYNNRGLVCLFIPDQGFYAE